MPDHKDVSRRRGEKDVAFSGEVSLATAILERHKCRLDHMIQLTIIWIIVLNDFSQKQTGTLRSWDSRLSIKTALAAARDEGCWICR